MTPKAPRPEKTSVYLVDDHPGMRRGIAFCLAEQEDLCVCGEAGTAAEALPAISKLKPRIVVTDISLPGRDGLDLIKDIKACHRNARILAFSMHDESLYAERVLRAGAHGYVMKCASMDELISAIRHVRDGEFVLGSKVVRQLAARSAAVGTPATTSTVDCLTDREMEIFRLLGQGLERRAIAEQLSLSPKTIEAHRANIREKLGLETSTALRRHAMEFLREEATGVSG